MTEARGALSLRLFGPLRMKPAPKQRTVRAWAVVCKCHGWMIGNIEKTRKTARARTLSAFLNDGSAEFTVVPLTGTYTPKKGRTTR